VPGHGALPVIGCQVPPPGVGLYRDASVWPGERAVTPCASAFRPYPPLRERERPMPRPNGRDPETDPAAYLGQQLRKARLAAGFASQDALAAALGFERSTITKAESGARPPTDEVLDKWCEVCGISTEVREVLAGLTVVARRADGPVPTWFEDWLEFEIQARVLRIWQPLIVPGLLQTGDYARALFLAADVDSDKADEMVTARLARQGVFDRPAPPSMSVVLDESVLHRLIGSPQVMCDQLTRVARWSERPAMRIQVLPTGNGANAGLGGAINLAEGDGSQELLLTEAVEDQTTERRFLIRKASDIFDLVRADALPRAASRALILEAAEQWKTR
jgi:transcriptional regulator with XRE-family HTH domain